MIFSESLQDVDAQTTDDEFRRVIRSSILQLDESFLQSIPKEAVNNGVDEAVTRMQSDQTSQTFRPSALLGHLP
jgi:hypothetical protein